MHLMKPENERVDVHELRGFIADDLQGAFQESYAISRATKCKQHLFSLSINPPASAELTPEAFVDAADQVEKRLGLEGQPRAIVFHEKRGTDGELRRHAHAVWCRIDAETMTAKQLSFSHEKLREVSRELHIQHDLQMPPGLINSHERNPRNFTLEQWQQCKRAEKDPRAVKEAFQDSWATSDSTTAFAHALEEHGYFLAKGRRGHIAVDYQGEAYAVSRYVGVKAKDVRARLGDAKELPSVEEAHAKAAQQVTDRLKELEAEQRRESEQKRQQALVERERLKAEQAKEAERLRRQQDERQRLEEEARQARIRHGLFGLWDRLTGRRQQTETQNRQEAEQAQERDRKQADEQARIQAAEAQAQREQAKIARSPHIEAVRELRTDIRQLSPHFSANADERSKAYIEEQRAKANMPRRSRSRDGPSFDR
ncbi:relaxase [Martelella alba]|uniref:Relaxase n=2 Tax=Martelella alba TaxID=2590451 RepID=A0A506TY42_9HYPH|nr:relaxase [Martelella alba]TPW26420.1 relaxase [Martelella alba]